jgi:hypothetical protein
LRRHEGRGGRPSSIRPGGCAVSRGGPRASPGPWCRPPSCAALPAGRGCRRGHASRAAPTGSRRACSRSLRASCVRSA